MANWQGPAHARAQPREDLAGEPPREAYLMQRADGSWTFGVGDPGGERAAVIVAAPIASAPGQVKVDSDETLDHVIPILVGTNRIIL
jgi:hypothetical protein